MHSKNISKSEREWMGRVKMLPCGVCGQCGPSEAHHIEQGKHFLTVPVCKDCHTSNFLGIHGQKRNWLIYRKDEMDVLNDTIRKLSKP